MALASAAILSTTGILIRWLTQNYGLPALVLALWRDGFVTLSLSLGLGLLQPDLLRGGRNLAYLAGYGLVLAVFNSLWTLAVALNGAAVATVLVYCSAAFTALLGWWLLRERLGWVKILAVGLCLAGCVLVAEAFRVEVWRINLIGILSGVFSGLLYAVYTLLGRSAARRGLNPWTTLLYTFGFATLFLLGFNLLGADVLPGAASDLADLFWLKNAWMGWGMLALLAVGPTVMGFGLYNVSLVYLPASVSNLILTLEPVFTAVIAYLWLGERMRGVQIGGALLILGAVFFLRVYEGRANGDAIR